MNPIDYTGPDIQIERNPPDHIPNLERELMECVAQRIALMQALRLENARFERLWTQLEEVGEP